MYFQLTPVGLHCRNVDERAIQTFKNHLIAGISSVNPTFPLHLRDKLIPQALITLNLLRQSRINPHLSAYAQVHRAFDFNRTAPPGTKILAHVRPEDRKSWAVHTAKGYYIGPTMNHYRCHRVWIQATNSERIAQTLVWYPHNMKMPIPHTVASSSLQQTTSSQPSKQPTRTPISHK